MKILVTGFHDYNHLQMNAFAVVSDSGTLPEESSFFTSVGHPFPAVCIQAEDVDGKLMDIGIQRSDRGAGVKMHVLHCCCLC